MFPGISRLLLRDNGVHIQGVSSKEGGGGGVVRFATPISLKEASTLSDWLALLEQELMDNLAQQLTFAVKEIKEYICELKYDYIHIVPGAAAFVRQNY